MRGESFPTLESVPLWQTTKHSLGVVNSSWEVGSVLGGGRIILLPLKRQKSECHLGTSPFVLLSFVCLGLETETICLGLVHSHILGKEAKSC